MFPKWAWSGSREQFLHCDLENFAAASRRYTCDIQNSSVVGLFMTPIRQWKWLDRVVFECTCLLHIDPLQPSNFITSIWSGLVVQVVAALSRGNWQDFNWHDASRGLSAIAELLVQITWDVGRTSRFYYPPVFKFFLRVIRGNFTKQFCIWKLRRRSLKVFGAIFRGFAQVLHNYCDNIYTHFLHNVVK